MTSQTMAWSALDSRTMAWSFRAPDKPQKRAEPWRGLLSRAKPWRGLLSRQVETLGEAVTIDSGTTVATALIKVVRSELLYYIILYYIILYYTVGCVRA